LVITAPTVQFVKADVLEIKHDGPNDPDCPAFGLVFLPVPKHAFEYSSEFNFSTLVSQYQPPDVKKYISDVDSENLDKYYQHYRMCDNFQHSATIEESDMFVGPERTLHFSTSSVLLFIYSYKRNEQTEEYAMIRFLSTPVQAISDHMLPGLTFGSFQKSENSAKSVLYGCQFQWYLINNLFFRAHVTGPSNAFINKFSEEWEMLSLLKPSSNTGIFTIMSMINWENAVSCFIQNELWGRVSDSGGFISVKSSKSIVLVKHPSSVFPESSSRVALILIVPIQEDFAFNRLQPQLVQYTVFQHFEKNDRCLVPVELIWRTRESTVTSKVRFTRSCWYYSLFLESRCHADMYNMTEIGTEHRHPSHRYLTCNYLVTPLSTKTNIYHIFKYRYPDSQLYSLIDPSVITYLFTLDFNLILPHLEVSMNILNLIEPDHILGFRKIDSRYTFLVPSRKDVNDGTMAVFGLQVLNTGHHLDNVFNTVSLLQSMPVQYTTTVKMYFDIFNNILFYDNRIHFILKEIILNNVSWADAESMCRKRNATLFTYFNMLEASHVDSILAQLFPHIPTIVFTEHNKISKVSTYIVLLCLSTCEITITLAIHPNQCLVPISLIVFFSQTENCV